MRRVRIGLAAVLAVCLALCACGRTPEGESTTDAAPSAAETSAADVQTTAEQADVSAETEKPARTGFTIEDLRRENSLTNLVSAYTNVRVRGYFNGELTGETNYFWHDGEVASAEMLLYEGEKFYSGFIGTVDFEQVGDRLQGCRSVTGQDVFAHEDAIYSMVLSGDITDIRDEGERWSFRVLPEAGDAGQSECRCVAEKQTLALDEVVLTTADGDEVRHTIEHSPSLQPDDFGLLGGLDKPTRKVRVCTALHDEAGRETFDSVTFDVPYDLEIIPVADDRELALYMNERLTTEYVYPGNGRSYTVYATDAMG